MRRQFVWAASCSLLAITAISFVWPSVLWSLAVVGPLVILGVRDMTQKKQAVRRNFPLLGRMRYIFEAIRPEINQYFIESNTDGTPFSREDRSVVYQRAKQQLDTVPFGTQRDVYEVGYEWLDHSMFPLPTHGEPPRIVVGENTCREPYSAALLNIAAMSYGALSKNAVLALNRGAKLGEFAHNTGEGGISPYHVEHGGDLVWQIGTGYFGCRKPDGQFCEATFAERAASPTVKMIEVKLSQGAKPGLGGILPGRKVTPELAAIRGVPVGQDVISPPSHSAFEGVEGMLRWVARLRDLSGKPVGIKICVGRKSEFESLCEGMVRLGLHPDYIVIDGAEGGTGAAPVEFANSVGSPLIDGLALAHTTLIRFGIRDRLKLIAAGKISTGFHLARVFALGADMAYSARAMMLALGCIQARKCNSNDCPVGVATQDANLVAGLDPTDKAVRVYNYHRSTLESFMELLCASGMSSPSQLRPEHIRRRISPVQTISYADLIRGYGSFELVSGEAANSDTRKTRRVS